MNHHLTRTVIILDRSGSMAQIREATISDFKEFLGKLKAGPADTAVAQFDDEYETVFDLPLQEVPLLTDATLVPRGMNARRAEERNDLTALERPDKVIAMTMTDGYENTSRRFTHAEIAGMVAHQQTVYRWQFMYLGANQDAIRLAAGIGIRSSAALAYRARRSGVTNSFLASAAGIQASIQASRRRGVDVSFSAMDRRNAGVEEEDDESSPEDEENHEIIEAGNVRFARVGHPGMLVILDKSFPPHASAAGRAAWQGHLGRL